VFRNIYIYIMVVIARIVKHDFGNFKGCKT
jgi:hypothetical protein